MSDYAAIFRDAFYGYGAYLKHELLNPGWGNYVTLLFAVSVACFVAEQVAPWRKQQPWQRKDFWLDAWYMVFNFFIFSALGYAALSRVVSVAFNDALRSVFGWENLVAIEISSWPLLAKLAVMFVVRDFIHWNVHRLLHRSDRLWQFHKVHHSVTQMGFAAHLRYHWMETIVYRTLEYIPLAMLGFGLTDFFIVHAIALTIGHLNHSNVRLPVGPLRYIFNTPQMHIWHHAYTQPGRYGCNFGISLSLWDWLFKTAWWPSDGRDIALGFEGLHDYPDGWVKQELSGFGRIPKPEAHADTAAEPSEPDAAE